MTNIALYFKQLKNQYPFLWKIWDVHNNFDEPVDLSTRNKLYHEFCNPIISRLGKHKMKHYDLCVKLVRNLKLFCTNTGECKFDRNDCNNLNNWLFISIVKDKLIPYIYIYIFDLIKRISPNLSYQNECLYYFYGKNYFEPLSIVILNIFQSNIDLIRQTLIGSKDKIYCSCQQFVYNVVRRYKHMNSTYCHVDQTKLREKNKNTCLFLKQFETTYYAYLINDGSIQKEQIKLPSLKREDTLEFVPCIPDDGIHQSLNISESQIPPEEPVELFETKLNDQMDLFQNPEYFTTSVFIKNVLPTTLAIIAAASSLFFLIYKYTLPYLFPEWEEVMENATNDKTTVYDGQCKEIEQKIPKDINFIDYSLCKGAMLYLKEIRRINDNKREGIGCKYLYYFLYQKTERKNNRNSLTKKAYYYLLQKYKSYIEDACKNYKEINITNDEIDKLDSIHQYYTCLNIIKKVNTCSEDIKECFPTLSILNNVHKTDCVYNNNQKFCEELVFLNNQFNEKAKALNCDNTEHVLMFSYQKSSEKRPIIIVIVVVLLISFLLINVYKFTPYGLLLRRVLKDRTNVFNNENEEWNIFKLPEINNSASANNVYNITYKST